jgi:hypothetical protein
MLFRQDILQGIADGRVTLAFRRWRKAPLAAGSTLRTPVGVLAIEGVSIVEEGDITADDLRRTGMSSDALRASLAGDGTLLRIELRLVGDDPRVALREQPPAREELAAIVARLARLDAATTPWTTQYLRLIDRQPATVARLLAPQVGSELPRFKRRVRQLKELGLTEGLEVGYRLSPRGAQVFAHLVSLDLDAVRAEPHRPATRRRDRPASS